MRTRLVLLTAVPAGVTGPTRSGGVVYPHLAEAWLQIHYHWRVLRGRESWRLPKPYAFKASPVGANGRLYLASEHDDVIVVRMGPTFEILATNTLEGQTFIATPAIVDGEIYLRGQNTLFAIR